jgi:uncharacterized protein (DUF1800 family)
MGNRFASGLAAACGVVLVAVSGIAAAAGMGLEDARHLLARAAFGGTPAEIAEFARLSRGEAVARLITQANRPRANLPDAELVRIDAPPGRDASPEERRDFVRDQTQRTMQLRGWWVGEMLAPRAPLAERMTLFWHNHFVVSEQKVRRAGLLYRNNAMMREHAVGSFGAMLHAVAQDPAMLLYLDAARNTRNRPNENFAREVMELFTLGEGKYAESDIREAARAFTGWSVAPDSGEFIRRQAQHDTGEKTVLGRTGAFDGAAVLDILLEQPSTAEFIVAKLWREFVSPLPDAAEVRRIAAAFRERRYDIAVALRELLTAQAFWAPEHRGVLIKSPVDFLVGTLKQFGAGPADAPPLAVAFALGQLGQNLFAPPNVRGWPGGETWINSSTLLARKQLVDRLLRAEEAPAQAMAPTMTGGAEGAMRAQLRRTLNGMQLGTANWFTSLKQVPGATPEAMLLAVPPAGPVPQPVSGRTELKVLLMDAAYQVK